MAGHKQNYKVFLVVHQRIKTSLIPANIGILMIPGTKHGFAQNAWKSKKNPILPNGGLMVSYHHAIHSKITDKT